MSTPCDMSLPGGAFAKQRRRTGGPGRLAQERPPLYSRGVPPIPVPSDAAAADRPVRGALGFTPTYNDDYTGWPVGAEAPHPRRLRDVPQPDHGLAFGDAAAAAWFPQGDRHPRERRRGPPPRLRHRGRQGRGREAGLADHPAQRTRSRRRGRHRPLPLPPRPAGRRGRGAGRGGAGDRPDVPGLVARAPRGACVGGWEARPRSTRFGPAGSSPR